MTFEVLKRVSATDNLSDALRVISESPRINQGVIHIACGAVKGVVAFVNGRITGAEVTGSSERGQRALTKLLALDGAICKFAEFDDLLLSNEYQISVDMHQLVIASDSQTVTQGMKLQTLAQVADIHASAVAHNDLKEKEGSISAGESGSGRTSDGGSIAVDEKPDEVMSQVIEPPARVPLAESAEMDSEYTSVTIDVPMTQGQRSELTDLYESAMADEAERSAQVIAQANLMDSMQKAAGVLGAPKQAESAETAQAITETVSDAAAASADTVNATTEAELTVEASAKPSVDEGDNSSEVSWVLKQDLTASLFDDVTDDERNQITPTVSMSALTMEQAQGSLDFGLDATPPALPVAEQGAFDASVPDAGTTGSAPPVAEIAAPSADAIGEPPPDSVPEHTAAKEAYGVMVQDQRFDNMIKEWEREEEKADFLSSDPSLTDIDESALSPDQKMLLEEMRKIHDPELFNESDPTLQVETEAELAMTDAQVELLLRTKLDEKPFQVEGIDPDLAAAESTELPLSKRNELEFFTHANKEEFDIVDGRIAEDGTIISDEERFLLENHPVVPDEIAREEFLKADPALKDLDRPILREFAPLAGEDAAALANLPDAPVAQATADDYSPLVAMPDQPKDQQPEGLIGRVRGMVTGKMGAYDGERIREQFAPEKLIGPALLVVICIAMFTVPGWLKSSASGVSSDDLARQQMRLAIEDEISAQTPYVTRERPTAAAVSGAQGSTSGGIGGGAGGGSEGSSEISSSDLGRAERLASEGKFAQAAGIYESYMGGLGGSVKFRIKLIRLYIEAKEWEKAKIMCLSALKMNPSETQRDEIWQMYRALI